MNGSTIIVKWKGNGKVFARNISMVKKYKHISDCDKHSDIDSSGSAEMNTMNEYSSKVRIQTIEKTIWTM